MDSCPLSVRGSFQTKYKTMMELVTTTPVEMECIDFYESNKDNLIDIKPKKKVKKKLMTFDSNKPNKLKYLIINRLDMFDAFTDKYGYLRKAISSSARSEYILGIRWKQVKNDFKGIKIVHSANFGVYDRYRFAPFKGGKYPSWYDGEFFGGGKFL